MGVSDILPYHASLRALGQVLDADRASLLTLCEIHGGFLLQYLQGGDPCAVTGSVLPYAEVLDIVDRWEPVKSSQPPWLARLWPMGRRGRAAEHRQPPQMGYADRFHALGHALDLRKARAVVIAELDAAVQVEYTVERATTVFRHGQRLVAHGRYAQHYTAEQLDDAVHACAAQIAETVRRAGIHLAENPADIRACLAGAAALEEAGDFAEAERLYRHAVAMVPILREAHYHLARLAFRRGDLAAALHDLQPATTEETGDGRPFYLLGQLHDRRCEPRAAVWALEMALARDPDNPLYAFELERLREKAVSAQAGEAPRGMRGVLGQENAHPAGTDTRGAGGATPASAVPSEEPAPVPQTVGVRRRLPPGISDLAYVPQGHGTAAPYADQALGDAAAQGRASLDALSASCDRLPSLGLAAANGWERPVWPSLDVPVDSAAAAAALPLAVAHLSDVPPQGDTRPMHSLDGRAGAGKGTAHQPAMDVERSLTDTGVAQ